MDGTEFKSYSCGEYIEDGIYDGLDEQVYRDGPGWSSTEGKRFLDPAYTPLHRAAGSSGIGINPSVAAIGQYAHAKVLEPHRLINDPVLFEVWHGATRQGGFHARREEIEPFGTRLITTKEFEAGSGAGQAILDNPAMRSFVDHPNTAKELSIFGKDPEYDISTKARIDLYNYDKGYLGDIKTTQSAAPQNCQKKAEEYLYGFQMAWYERRAVLSGLPVNKWFIFWAEKKAPFATHITVFSDDAMKAAREQLHAVLQMVAADTHSEEPSTGWPVWTSIQAPQGDNLNP
ncbi:MAG: PD-(D/E)XK nuclease-like domain-containing protein [Paracoccaceae bacterium]